MVSSDKQCFCHYNVCMCVGLYVEISKDSELICYLHKKHIKKHKTVVGLESTEEIYVGLVCFFWLLLLLGFLCHILCVLSILRGMLCVMRRYYETDSSVLFVLSLHTKCVCWWYNAATRYTDPAGVHCEYCQAVPEPSMSPARFDEF